MVCLSVFPLGSPSTMAMAIAAVSRCQGADSVDPGPAQPDSGPEVKVPPLRLPKTGQAVRLSQCMAEEREELEERCLGRAVTALCLLSVAWTNCFIMV